MLASSGRSFRTIAGDTATPRARTPGRGCATDRRPAPDAVARALPVSGGLVGPARVGVPGKDQPVGGTAITAARKMRVHPGLTSSVVIWSDDRDASPQRSRLSINCEGLKALRRVEVEAFLLVREIEARADDRDAVDRPLSEKAALAKSADCAIHRELRQHRGIPGEPAIAEDARSLRKPRRGIGGAPRGFESAASFAASSLTRATFSNR